MPRKRGRVHEAWAASERRPTTQERRALLSEPPKVISDNGHYQANPPTRPEGDAPTSRGKTATHDEVMVLLFCILGRQT